MMSDDLTAERQAVHSLVWGDHDVLADEIDAGHLVAGYFVGPAHRAVLAAVLDLVAERTIPAPAAIHDRLVATGWRPAAATDAVLCAGTYAPWTGQLRRLPGYLELVAEDHERRRMRERVVALADQLDRSGGPARVAAELGVAS